MAIGCGSGLSNQFQLQQNHSNLLYPRLLYNILPDEQTNKQAKYNQRH